MNANQERKSLAGMTGYGVMRFVTVARDAESIKVANVTAKSRRSLDQIIESCLFVILGSLYDEVVPWLVIFAIDHHWSARSLRETSEESVSARFDIDSFPNVQIGDVHYLTLCSGDGMTQAERLRQYLLEKEISGLNWESFEFPVELDKLFEGEDSFQYGIFVMDAHPAGADRAAIELLNLQSGVCSLSRTSAREDWQIHTTVTNRGYDSARLTYRDPSKISGLAVRLPRSLNIDDFPPRHSTYHGVTDFNDVVHFDAPFACAPLGKDDITRTVRLVNGNVYRKVVFLMLQTPFQPSPPTTVQLQTALRFWANAELASHHTESIELSPLMLAETYLSYCTVVEVLLGAPSGVTESVATRGAAIITDRSEDRLDHSKKIKKLYDKRSKYVHEGELSIKRSDVMELREFVRVCLIYAIHWASHEIPKNFATGHIPNDEYANELIVVQGERTLQLYFVKADFRRHCDLLKFGGEKVKPLPSDQSKSES